MTGCDFCGEDFDSRRDLHLHWGEEHRDELNSHQREKVKKARRKNEEEEQARMGKRKNLLGWGLAGVLGVLLVAFMASQLSSPGKQSFDLEGQPTLGDPNASVSIVFFADYRCPYCKQFETGVMPRLIQNYVRTGEASITFINYPFLGPGSTQAAVAGECVYRQDEQQFWDFHNYIYEHQGPESQRWISVDLLMRYANKSTEGLDYEKLRSCIQEGETLGEVRSDKQLGQRHGVSSTPSVFVNGQYMKNRGYRSLSAKIEHLS